MDTLRDALTGRLEQAGIPAGECRDDLAKILVGAVREITTKKALARALDDMQGFAERETLRADEAERRLAELENALAWETSCTGCAKTLDASIREHERADRYATILRVARTAADMHRVRHPQPEDGCAACNIAVTLQPAPEAAK